MGGFDTKRTMIGAIVLVWGCYLVHKRAREALRAQAKST